MTLKQQALSAGRWTATSAALATGFQVLQTAVLARLLLPADFGLMAVAAAILAVLALIADLGLSRALIHFDHVSNEALSSLYWLNLALAFVLMIVLTTSAPALGSIYQSKSLVQLLRVAALVFPITAFGQQYRVLAEKSLRFNELARIEVVASLIGFCTAIAAALANAGVYALVAGILARVSANSLLAWWKLSLGHRPSAHFCLRETRPYLYFGAYLTGDSFASTVMQQADVFIGGLVLGPTAMGAYSVSRDLSLRMTTVINPVITRVGFPIMSRVKHDREQVKAIYLHTMRMIASINFPIYIALGLFANEFVALLYGPKWYQAAVYLRILAAWGLVRSTGNPVGSLLYAVGKAKRAFWWNIGLLLVLPPLYWLAVHDFGLMGLAVALVMIQLIVFLPAWRLLVQPCCGASIGEYLREVAVPLWTALSAGALACLATNRLDHGTMRLIIGGASGGASYLALSWLFNRAWMTAMLELFGSRAHMRAP